MQHRSLPAIGFAMLVGLGVCHGVAADTHHTDPPHHDPHVDPHHLDPHHHADPPHHTDPHHHAGDPHHLNATPHLVDASDLHLWHANFGLHGSATHMQGNADGDLDVDGSDFLVWQRQLGSEVASSPVTASIPEPTSFMLAAGAVGIALASRRRLSK